MIPFICILLNFFPQCSIVFWVQVFYSFIKFIYRYFIFLFAIVNGIIFIASLSCISLFVYKNAINFWILTLYPTILLNSLIRSSKIFCGDYRVFYVHYHVIRKQWQFFCLLPIWMPFVSFCHLTAVARTSNTMLNESSEIVHPCSWS